MLSAALDRQELLVHLLIANVFVIYGQDVGEHLTSFALPVQVIMYDCFRPGDVVRAEVISLGDARSYYLSTAKVRAATHCLQEHKLVVDLRCYLMHRFRMPANLQYQFPYNQC